MYSYVGNKFEIKGQLKMDGNECKKNTKNTGETVEEVGRIIHEMDNIETVNLHLFWEQSDNQSVLDEYLTSCSDNKTINEINEV